MSGGGICMELRYTVLFIIVILLTAGLSMSFCPSSEKDICPFVKAFADVTSGRYPLNISFSYDVYNVHELISTIQWDFGDGTKSIGRSLNHTYLRGGDFYSTVTIWFENGNCICDTLEIHVVECHTPCASISAYGTCGKPPLIVSFLGVGYDLNGQIVGYMWDFGDGVTSTEQNPTHTYDTAGRYYARLTIRADCGLEGSDVIEIHVIKNYLPLASARADLTEGKAPLKVNFFGYCNDEDDSNISYHWVFENTLLPAKRESDQQNATHLFWSPGVYNVTLTVVDEDGATDEIGMQITVHTSIISWGLQLVIKKLIRNCLPDKNKEIIDRWISDYIAKKLF